MTTLLEKPAPPAEHVPLRHARLPRWAPLLVVVVSFATSGLVGLLLGWTLAPIVIVALLVYLVVLPLWSRIVENSRAATDRFVTGLIWVALGIAFVPLVSLLWTVLREGLRVISDEFSTYSMRNVVGEKGGIYHAIIGTLLITGAAAVISVPIGLLTAIYLVEYDDNSRMASSIRFLVDVMTGIPSIVAGLFAYALFVGFFGPGVHMGLGGARGLSLLMIPLVVRSAEEMLKLVPADLREAAYALGVPKWKTIVRIVLPTALAGIITGITLAIARVIGETAPLLIIAGSTDSTNFNLFKDQMMTLPVFIYYSYTQPGNHPEIARPMAWGAALVLILIVLALNVLARVLGRIFAPARGH